MAIQCRDRVQVSRVTAVAMIHSTPISARPRWARITRPPGAGGRPAAGESPAGPAGDGPAAAAPPSPRVAGNPPPPEAIVDAGPPGGPQLSGQRVRGRASALGSGRARPAPGPAQHAIAPGADSAPRPDNEGWPRRGARGGGRAGSEPAAARIDAGPAG